VSGPLPTYPSDLGCDLAPRCLECPFPLCRYDGKDTAKRLSFVLAGEKAARLRAEGYSIDQIAQRTGCTKRAVYRRLAIARGETGEPSRRRPLIAHRTG